MYFRFTRKVMVYPGPGAWRFVSLSKKDSELIRKTNITNRIGKKDGWGHTRVKATIGETSWISGLWPKPDSGVFLLVINAPVRKKERILVGDTVQVTIDLQ